MYSCELMNFCKNKKVSIYGIGENGMRIFAILKECNVEIESFIISNNQEKKICEKEGIKVLFLNEWLQKKFSRNIVVATSEKVQKEICNNLKETGIKNYYCINQKDVYRKKIGVLDTTVSAENNGNQIIMDCVNKEVRLLHKDNFIFKFPFMDIFDNKTLEYMSECEYLILGGTNALTSNMDKANYIGITEHNADIIENKIILAGVGWYEYEEGANDYTKYILNKVLSKKYIHSVRDSYTEEKLREIGISNVINTGCLTLWDLSKNFCETIPKIKGENVLVMFTPNHRETDQKIMDIVKRNYENVFFWPQAKDDYLYIKSLNTAAIPISPTLNRLEEFLKTTKSVDYVGTRLHGGIKCLREGKRTIIFAIDNRATEMGKDFALPVYALDEIERLDDIINNRIECKVEINQKNISLWRKQFLNCDL